MAIRKIHEVPSELPHARLFLDDVEEISNILLDAITPALAESNKEPKITYVVGDSEMDSIDDLQTRGGSTTDFHIAVGDFLPAGIRFKWFSNPEFTLYSLDEREEWAVYAKIKSIFDRRQLRIKNAVKSLPEWLRFSLWVLLFIVVPWLIPPRWPKFGVGYFVFLALLAYVVYRPSRVFLVRSHESSKVSSATRKGYIERVMFLVAGTLIGALITELVRRFFK